MADTTMLYCPTHGARVEVTHNLGDNPGVFWNSASYLVEGQTDAIACSDCGAGLSRLPPGTPSND